MPFSDFTREERALFRRLDSPGKIQDFLNGIPANEGPDADTCRSPRMALRANRAHCIEGAMLAAAILRFHGERPLIVDLEAASWDYDHVIAVYRRHGHWGAISKTNHPVLRYREPIYRTVRELVLSYFHEYVPIKGDRKSLRRYSDPVDLSRFDGIDWMTSEDEVWDIADYLCTVRHRPILNRSQLATLRRIDPIEVRASDLVEWPKRKASARP